MAYQSKNLSVLSYSNGFTHWHYTTTETDPNFFGSYFKGTLMLARGDKISIVWNTDAKSGIRSGDFLVLDGDQGTLDPWGAR